MAVIAKKIRQPVENLLESEARSMLAMYKNFAERAQARLQPMYDLLDEGRPPSYAMWQLRRSAANINNEIAALVKYIAEWEDDAYPRIYAGGQIDGILDLGTRATDQLGFAKGVMNRRAMELLNEEINLIQDSEFHQKALSILKDTLYTGKNIDATVRDRYQRALAQMNRTIASGMQGQYIEATAGRRWDDTFRAIGLDTASGVVTGEMSWDQAMRKQLKMFEQMGIGSFTDAGGKVWHLRDYAEMVSRTVTMNVLHVGKMNEFLEYGQDLVIVSSLTPTGTGSERSPCRLCAPWEGRILSISGATKGYPTIADAENAGLFHPRCLHHWSAFIPELYTPEERKAAGWQGPDDVPELPEGVLPGDWILPYRSVAGSYNK